MPDKDVILAVLQSAIGLAGLLLVFAGFVLTKADSLSGKWATPARRAAFLTLLPFFGNLFLAYMSVRALRNPLGWACCHLLFVLDISLLITALVGIVGLVVSL
jgi:hypothetical protein